VTVMAVDTEVLTTVVGVMTAAELGMSLASDRIA
jgi:hypothetical protein